MDCDCGTQLAVAQNCNDLFYFTAQKSHLLLYNLKLVFFPIAANLIQLGFIEMEVRKSRLKIICFCINVYAYNKESKHFGIHLSMCIIVISVFTFLEWIFTFCVCFIFNSIFYHFLFLTRHARRYILAALLQFFMMSFNFNDYITKFKMLNIS